MQRNHSDKPFERYADGAIVHCKSRKAAERLLQEIDSCGLSMHSGKTKVVYCKGGSRQGHYPVTHSDFLEYRFQRRWHAVPQLSARSEREGGQSDAREKFTAAL
ncbi:hypothetical protein [Mycoavidus cysteinexigens]|uniref:hypothetical protein n=1 Tax=Mycoavidus cysteinexigens TaxID=1553431 RepID=UPI0005EE7D78|nr:hypothetical protein [Mycoavidus cysteinexigens]